MLVDDPNDVTQIRNGIWGLLMILILFLFTYRNMFRIKYSWYGPGLIPP